MKMKVVLNRENHKYIPQALKNMPRRGINRLEVHFDHNSRLFFDEMVDSLSAVLDHEYYFPILLVDLPFCVLGSCAADHIVSGGSPKRGKKSGICGSCKYNDICSGFPEINFDHNKKNVLSPIRDIPTEIMIELESKCNFKCPFCYNHNSFAKEGRQKNELPFELVVKIIDHISELGIKIIRFTGGEPFLRGDLIPLMEYSKERGLEVRLNTNCSLIKKDDLRGLKGVLDNVLIPIESYSSEREAEITGFKDSLQKKIEAVRSFKEIGVPMVRVGTVAIGDNILNFSKLSDLVLDLPVDIWEFYRPISSPATGREGGLDRDDVGLITEKITNKIKETGRNIIIANSIPFCAVENPNRLGAISTGALFDEGHNRMVVDPRGFVKPHYFLDENIGDPLDLFSAWNHPFMRKMRSMAFLPDACNNCVYKRKCLGGSRFESHLFHNDHSREDPLSEPSNKIDNGLYG